jgi:hypothetical protein
MREAMTNASEATAGIIFRDALPFPRRADILDWQWLMKRNSRF